MSSAKKKLVWDQTDIELEGLTIAKAEAYFHSLSEEYGSEAYVDKDYPGYDGGYELVLKFQREETDAEFKKRLRKEEADRKAREKQAEKKRDKELRELKRLQKKYGKETDA